MDCQGPTPFKGGPLRAWLKVWLEGLDRGKIATWPAYDLELSPRTRRVWDRAPGWRLIFTALPLSSGKVGGRDVPLVAIYSDGTGKVIENVTPLLGALKEKAKRYGCLKRPYVVAVLDISEEGMFADEEDDAVALYGGIGWDVARNGQVDWPLGDDGFWHGPKGPRNEGVSAVLIGRALSVAAPGSITRAQSALSLTPSLGTLSPTGCHFRCGSWTWTSAYSRLDLLISRCTKPSDSPPTGPGQSRPSTDEPLSTAAPMSRR